MEKNVKDKNKLWYISIKFCLFFLGKEIQTRHICCRRACQCFGFIFKTYILTNNNNIRTKESTVLLYQLITRLSMDQHFLFLSLPGTT